MKPGSPAARIAASEAALGNAKPIATETGGKSAAIAAARSAAKAVADAPVPPAAKPRAKAFELTEDDIQATAAPRNLNIGKHIKTVLIAGSVVVIVLAVLYTAMDLLLPGNPSDSDQLSAPASTPAERPVPSPSSSIPSRPMPTPEGSLPPPASPEPDTTGQIGNQTQFFDPTTMLNGARVARRPTSPDRSASRRRSAMRRPRPPTPTPRSPDCRHRSARRCGRPRPAAIPRPNTNSACAMPKAAASRRTSARRSAGSSRPARPASLRPSSASPA